MVRWRRVDEGESRIEDRRGQRIPGGMPAAGGIGGLGLIGILIALFFGGNILGGGDGGFGIDAPPLPPGQAAVQDDVLDNAPDPDADLRGLVDFVAVDVDTVWREIFTAAGLDYRDSVVVVFNGQTISGCGPASSATGPFYCPRDQKVYIDLSFFRQLGQRFGAPGDFAQAYVVAHEIAHHVQRQLGTEGEVRQLQQQNPGDANELSIRLELQADCYSGVWAHSAFNRNLLDPGDVEEGLGAAAAVGDDTIQERTQGRVDPESWNHGSAEQRTDWFQRGFDSGDPRECNTFS